MNYPPLFLSTDSIQNSFSSSSKKVQSLPPLHSQYECEECDYKTAKKESMRQHKLVKHSRTANKCSACSYTHYYKAQVRQHFNRAHLKIKRNCTKSCFVMDCKNAEKEQCEKMGHNRIFCEQCDHFTLTRRSMKHHIQTKHEGLIFKCHQCNFVSTTKQTLTSHINTKHEGLIFKCHQCNFVSKTKRTLTSHINTKHEGLMLNCHQYNFISTTKRTLSSHISFAHDGEVFSCEQCSHFFRSKKALKLHLKIHNRKQHNIKEESEPKANPNPRDTEAAFHKCNQCDYASVKAYNLKRHFHRHHSHL